MKWNGVGILGLVVLATIVPGAGLAYAKKPPKPPPPLVDTGTVYYGHDPVCSLLPDGSGQAVVVAGLPKWSPPSQLRHGGSRWFLTIGPIPNQTYPDGRMRHEVFAVSETGPTGSRTPPRTEMGIRLMLVVFLVYVFGNDSSERLMYPTEASASK